MGNNPSIVINVISYPSRAIRCTWKLFCLEPHLDDPLSVLTRCLVPLFHSLVGVTRLLVRLCLLPQQEWANHFGQES